MPNGNMVCENFITKLTKQKIHDINVYLMHIS